MWQGVGANGRGWAYVTRARGIWQEEGWGHVAVAWDIWQGVGACHKGSGHKGSCVKCQKVKDVDYERGS